MHLKHNVTDLEMSFCNRRGLKGERLSVVSVEADVQCGRVKSETNLDWKIK